MLRFALISVTVLCAAIACRAQRVDTLPAYQPQQTVTGNLSNIRTWGELGLSGEWKDKRIHVYGFPVNRSSQSSFRMLR